MLFSSVLEWQPQTHLLKKYKITQTELSVIYKFT